MTGMIVDAVARRQPSALTSMAVPATPSEDGVPIPNGHLMGVGCQMAARGSSASPMAIRAQ